jgi:hypothetical protein
LITVVIQIGGHGKRKWKEMFKWTKTELRILNA